ncbi:MAG: sugar ABC transporter ATP-binding protein [Hydrogenibacillus schlegelii]|uniref:Sugar ABC transporter ATP-binding protein n=1 Tax=Hydrogenibacillus schlegelii TaxID=1484 RepID=A0A947CXZ4_HYDSH|nr:sugar ABC transporter ATP-binding protein [Hydrogenibacillus schlegelii]
MTTPLVEMEGISKSFHGVEVLRDVGFTLYAGEVHALLGENGAGKSTLMKILSGIYRKDRGVIRIRGAIQEIDSPRRAAELGIAVIHQELDLVPTLTVAENIFLGREPRRRRRVGLDRGRMLREAREMLELLGMDLDPALPVERLSMAEQQMVEIARALLRKSEILILDEPTAALTEREIDHLFRVLRRLKQSGTGMVYISHRMEEIFRLSDRITVLRDGRVVATMRTEEATFEALIRQMVGRPLEMRYPKKSVAPGPERLVVEHLSVPGKLHDISFAVRRGEILGVAGLVGAGRSELARALFGLEPVRGGTIRLDGRPIVLRHPRDAIRAGIAFVPEDRKRQGLVLDRSVQDNVLLPTLSRLSRWGWLARGRERAEAETMIARLSIRPPDPARAVRTLSGGNQQKVVVGKWLFQTPKVLMLDEPTRGVDVGAKREMYEIMHALAREGVAMLMISSDLPELLGMSDRILVLHEGRVSGRFTRSEATQEAVMIAMAGGA